MPSVAKFLNAADRCEAKIDEGNGDWVGSATGPHSDPDLVDFNKSLLVVRAHTNADYTAAGMKTW